MASTVVSQLRCIIHGAWRCVFVLHAKAFQAFSLMKLYLSRGSNAFALRCDNGASHNMRATLKLQSLSVVGRSHVRISNLGR